MQELMNTNSPGASASQPNAGPVLGSQVPGMNSEMAAKPGLTPYMNPMAQQLQSYGRNGDSMLIHMHPDEVKGLQQLAMAHGGSLTINPHTGLPEANFLKKLLPTILGVALNFIPGVGPLMSAALVGAGYTAATGSLKKGLMAGLQAYGGAGIGAGLSRLGTAAASAALPTAGSAAANTGLAAVKNTLMNNLGAQSGLAPFGQAAQAVAGEGVKQAATEVGKQTIGQAIKSNALNAGSGLKSLANAAMSNPIDAVKLAGSNFSGAVKADPWLRNAPFLQKVAPFVAGQGAFSGVASAMQPNAPKFDATTSGSKWVDEGPYVTLPREVNYAGDEESNFEGGGERLFFNPSMPQVVPLKSLSPEQRKQYGYAEGGLAALPASEQFKKLVEFYNEGRPGAITASLTYPKKAAPTTPTSTGTANTGTTNTGTTNTGTTNTGTTNTGTGTTSTGSTEVTGTGTDTLQGRYGVYTPGGGWGVNPRVVSEDSIDGRDATGPHTSEVRPIGSPGAPVLTGPISNYGVQDNSSLNDIIASNIDRINADNGVTQDMLNRAANNMFGTTGVNYYAQTGNQGASTQGGGQAVNTGQTMGGNALTLYDGSPFTLGDDFLAGTEARAAGGRINMGDGSFVVDARTVSELGNGSSNAGIDLLSRMGGQPVRGPGDGVSDSVPASIGGRQAARVARDEVIFPPQAVRRMGGGNENRGTQKLYAMMDKAHAARKRAGRGTDTKLRRGLA